MPDSFLPGFPQCIQKLVKKFVAMLYRKYDGLIYPTDFLRKKFTDCHFNVPEAVIGNGVDTAIFYPNEKKLSDYFSLLYVGRLDARKNISLLLEALKILHDQKKLHANFHCTIVG
jgi:glycosyltransferase involved in cell wall biosynthesis